MARELKKGASTRPGKSVAIPCCALLASLMSFDVAAQLSPCDAGTGTCKVTVGATKLKLEPGAPTVGEDGFGFKTKYEEIGGFVLPLNGGLTTWEVGGRSLVFSESFWYRVGPANVANPASNPEHYWVDPTAPLEGTQGVLPGGVVGRIAATTEGALAQPGGIQVRSLFDVANLPGSTLLNEKVVLINTTGETVKVTLFAYTDLDISSSPFGGDTASGQLVGVGNTNAEIWQYDETGRRVKVTGLGASSFDLQYFGGRTIASGGAPSILDLLNRPDLVADFTNQLPETLLSPADITHVIQWSDIEIAAGESREVALVKEYFTPEPSSELLVMAPLLAMFWSSRKRNVSKRVER